MLIETIKSKGKTIAHIFRKELKAEGVKFLTPPDYPLQLGLLEHSAGKLIREHAHNPEIKYKVDTTQEFLLVEKGRVRIDLFNDNWKKVKTVFLSGGDFILFVSGGHGFKVLRKCRMIEVKQGPYPGDKKAKLYRKDTHG